jgi:hypothetical protein
VAWYNAIQNKYICAFSLALHDPRLAFPIDALIAQSMQLTFDSSRLSAICKMSFSDSFMPNLAQKSGAPSHRR